MSKLPSMPWYASDWLGSTSRATMTLEEQGAYFCLLNHQWASPECRLLFDPASLTRLLGLQSQRTFFRIWSTLAPRFKTEVCPKLAPNFGQTSAKLSANLGEVSAKLSTFIYNERCRLEWQKAREKADKNRAAVNSRWARNGDTNAYTNGIPPDPYPDPNINTPPIKSPKGDRARKSKPSKYSVAFENFFGGYPKRVGKENASRAYANAVKKIMVRDGCTNANAHSKLLAACMAFAKSPLGQSERFCPHPSTWLNGGHYDDDRKTWARDPDHKPEASPTRQLFSSPPDFSKD